MPVYKNMYMYLSLCLVEVKMECYTNFLFSSLFFFSLLLGGAQRKQNYAAQESLYATYEF